jgi:eukaryotic-like serine/threonine-protein kinase
MTENLPAESLSVEALVSQVVDEFMERLDRGERPVVEDYAGRHPTIANVLRQVLPALELVRFSTPDAEAVTSLTGCLGDYCIVREIGRGGMGVVYEAEQISLQRRVALKVLPFAAALDARQLQRFKNEAQAAAHLHHQNIVPVYAVGCERGVHYYAMQYIEGNTLATVIDAYKKGVPPLLQGETQSLAELVTERSAKDAKPSRAAANLAVQAAEALEYAHQMGIVHRDIKPANLLLDTRRNLWIADFGLAHIQGDARITRTGDLLGTMRYMSPEQALGHGSVDQRSDVYSLGATLFELLTLKPAFNGKDRQELLRQIAFEEPLALRQADSAIPVELETIVLKAMAKEPEGRYARAQDLADDLRRFLNDLPIHARRPTVLDRARRWTRRHRPIVAWGLVSLALLVVAGVLGLVFYNAEVRQERDEKNAALEAAETQRRKAEANLNRALDAIERMLKQVNDGDIASGPHMDKVRLKISADALELCQQLLQDEGAGPEARFCTARAFYIAGTVKFNAGQAAAGQENIRKALDLYRDLARDFPESSAYRSAWALACLDWGLHHFGRPEEAERFVQQAVSLWRELVDGSPANGSFREHLATAITKRGYVHWSMDRIAEAEADYGEALRLAAGLEGGSTQQTAQATLLQIEALNSLGVLQRTDGRFLDAEASFRKVLALTQKAGQGDTQDARAQGHLGILLWLLGRPEEAEVHLRKAVLLRTNHVAMYPSSPGSRQEMALTNRWLAQCLAWTGRPEAETELRKVLLAQEAIADQTHASGDRSHLATSQCVLANLYRDTGHLAEAAPLYQRALLFLEDYAAAAPDNLDRQLSLGVTADHYGQALAAQGQPNAARGAFQKALQVLTRAVQLGPNRHDTHHCLARFLAGCSDPVLRDPARAIQEGQMAVALGPQVGFCRNALALAYYRADRCADAIEIIEQALPLRNGGDSFSWFILALAHAKLGHQARANDCYGQAVAWMEKYQPKNVELQRLSAEAGALLSQGAQKGP